MLPSSGNKETTKFREYYGEQSSSAGHSIFPNSFRDRMVGISKGVWLATSEYASNLRKIRRCKGGLDDTSVNSQNGDDDAGKEKRGKLVHVTHSHKYHQHHKQQEGRAINPHVVQHGCRLLQGIIAVEDGCLGGNVHLRGGKNESHVTCGLVRGVKIKKRCGVGTMVARDTPIRSLLLLRGAVAE